MKKVFTSILCLSMAFAAQAALHLSYFDEEGAEIEVTKDTTINYTAYLDNFGEVSMRLNGNISSDESKDFVVVLTRSAMEKLHRLWTFRLSPVWLPRLGTPIMSLRKKAR